jgi:hypothetical protein
MFVLGFILIAVTAVAFAFLSVLAFVAAGEQNWREFRQSMAAAALALVAGVVAILVVIR